MKTLAQRKIFIKKRRKKNRTFFRDSNRSIEPNTTITSKRNLHTILSTKTSLHYITTMERLYRTIGNLYFVFKLIPCVMRRIVVCLSGSEMFSKYFFFLFR